MIKSFRSSHLAFAHTISSHSRPSPKATSPKQNTQKNQKRNQPTNQPCPLLAGSKVFLTPFPHVTPLPPGSTPFPPGLGALTGLFQCPGSDRPGMLPSVHLCACPPPLKSALQGQVIPPSHQHHPAQDLDWREGQKVKARIWAFPSLRWDVVNLLVKKKKKKRKKERKEKKRKIIFTGLAENFALSSIPHELITPSSPACYRF